MPYNLINLFGGLGLMCDGFVCYVIVAWFFFVFGFVLVYAFVVCGSLFVQLSFRLIVIFAGVGLGVFCLYR